MIYDQSQLARMVHEIIIARVRDELGELSDKYGIPVEDVEKVAVKLYVEDVSKSQWKSSKARFIKLYEKELEMLFDNNVINFQELGFMVFLALKFTQYEDNTLRNPDGSYCTQKDIINISGMSKPTVSRLLKGLIEKKLNNNDRNGEYSRKTLKKAEDCKKLNINLLELYPKDKKNGFYKLINELDKIVAKDVI